VWSEVPLAAPCAAAASVVACRRQKTDSESAPPAGAGLLVTRRVMTVDSCSGCRPGVNWGRIVADHHRLDSTVGPRVVILAKDRLDWSVGRRIVADHHRLDSTVGKPRLIHAIRLILGTSREAASHALGREKRIAGKARRCEFAHHYKSAYRD